MKKPAPPERAVPARSLFDRLAIVGLCVGIVLMAAGVALGLSMYLGR